ncbi:DNA cytosine methyltransferase [Deinococcus rubellus]|uniref:DNA cytosine methyltransferase n=1 Tax=Deinococcus rubellus TaxID=1889240 RepID=UPI0031E5E0D0
MRFVELFAGIGLFRLGLEYVGPSWQCIMANDNSEMKTRAYRLNFVTAHLIEDDVAHTSAADIPPDTELITASFPCQDVSLAGNRVGLSGARTGNFYQFTRILEELVQAGRPPAQVLLENVTGLLSSHNGADIRSVLEALSALGYGLDILLLDAVHWLPQSRPRIFIVGRYGQGEHFVPFTLSLHPARPTPIERVIHANADLNWSFLELPALPMRRQQLADLVSTDVDGGFKGTELERELSYIRGASLTRLQKAQQASAEDGQARHLAGYRRMRNNLVCLELRDDGLAGCLRTATGGSSRQLLVEVTPNQTSIRYMTPREYARLMGLPETFALPTNTREALTCLGDAVAVPVIRWLGQVLEAQAAPHHAHAPELAPALSAALAG